MPLIKNRLKTILKRTGAGLLIAVLLLSASACSGKTDTETSVSETEIESVPQQEDSTSAAEADTDYYSRALAKRSQDFSPEDAEITAVAADLPRAEKNTTIMVYMIGSNLESRLGNATKDIAEMEAAGLSYQNENLLLYTGGARRWVSDIPADRNCVIDMSLTGEERIVAQTDGNSDMGAAQTLSAFVNFCTENYPAQHYALILWDHGGGSLWGYGADELYDSDSLLLTEMDNAMAETIFADGTKLDYVGFDACLMATLENMAVWEKYASYMVASEELEPGDGWDYTFLNTYESSSEPLEITRAIVEQFEEYYDAARSDYSNPDITLSVVDLGKIADLSDSVDGFAEALKKELDRGGYSQIMQTRGQAKGFGLSETANGSVSYYYDIVDLGDLADAFAGEFPEMSKALSDALENAVIFQTANISGANGVSMYYPYKNKGQYKELADTYGSLSVSENYRSFLSSNAAEWLSGRSRDWKLGRPKDNGDEYILSLTEDQIENMSGAYYMIADATTSGYRLPVQKVSLKPDEEGNLHLPKKLPMVTLTTDLGDSMVLPVTEVESDDDRIIYNSVRTRLISESAKILVPDSAYEEVTFTLEYDRKTNDCKIQKITTINSEDEFSGKNTVEADHWEGTEYNYFALSTTTDADGTLRPYTEWEENGFNGWGGSAVEDNFSFGIVYTGDSTWQLYAQILLEDTTGEYYATEMVPLAIDKKIRTISSKTEKGELGYLVYDDHAEVNTYQGEDTEIVIPEMIGGKPVTRINTSVFGKMILFDTHGTYPVQNVSLPDTIETIGNDAFFCCRKLESINFPKNLKEIGANAFYYCESLQKAELPDGLTRIGKAAFAYCSGMQEITIPKTVEYFGEGALMGCKSLEMINVASDNSKYMVDSGALYSIDGKTLYAWPAAGQTTYSVKDGTERIAYGAFMSAALTDAVLPEGLKIIDNYAFYNCRNLNPPVFPESLEEIGMYAFDIMQKSNPDEHDFAEYQIGLGPNVSYIGTGAFGGYIRKVISVAEDNPYFSSKDGMLMNKAGDALIEGSFNRRNQFIVPDGTMEFSFDMLYFFNNYFSSDMDMVKHIYIPDSVVRMPETDRIIGVENIVFHCNPGSAAEQYALKYGFDVSYLSDPYYEEAEVATAEGAMNFYIYGDYAQLVHYAGNDTYIEIPSEVAGKPVKKIGNGEYAISRNSKPLLSDEEYNDSPNIEKVIIPEGVEEISAYALSDFSTSHDIEIILPSTLKVIGNTGININGTLKLPEGIESLGEYFFTGKVEGIFTITPSMKYIDPKAFNGCKGITQFVLEEENEFYNVVDGVIYSKDGTELLFYPQEGPETISIPEGCEVIGEYAFFENKNLTEVNLPSSLKSIKDRAFSRCFALKDVYFPEAAESIIIGYDAFSYCDELTKIELNAVEEIGSSAFKNCDNLKNVILKEGLLVIGEYAFEETPYADISLPDSLRVIGKSAFDSYKDPWEDSTDVIRIGPNVSEIGYSAFSAIGATAFEVDPENQYYESKNGLLMSKGGAKTVSCPSGLEGEVFVPEGTLVIDDWTFRYAGKVTKIHIPSSVVTIGSVNFEEEFIHGDDGSITGKVYNVTICCKPGSYAYKFAQENGIPVIFD